MDNEIDVINEKYPYLTDKFEFNTFSAMDSKKIMR